jgi:hypothetical protein
MRALKHVLLFLSVTAAATIGADPVLTFEERAVIARVTPGATTALFGLASDSFGYTPKTSEYAEILEDGDRDGIVRFDLDAPAPASVWLVVDMTNGRRTIGTPAGVAVKRKALPPAALKRRGNAPAGVVIENETLAVCWVVRAGVGAWRMIAEDGAREDADGRSNASVSSELRALRAIGKSPGPPDDFAHGDIVVTVAFDGLAVADLRVDEGRR